MKKIKLSNRDKADLWLEQSKENSKIWNLKVDDTHKWVLKYGRVIMGDLPNTIEAVDPAGGPFINVGDTLEHGKYKIIKIIDFTTFEIWEE